MLNYKTKELRVSCRNDATWLELTKDFSDLGLVKIEKMLSLEEINLLIQALQFAKLCRI